MLAPTLAPARRRGLILILVLVLAMLGLMALIGVTFATLGGQGKITSLTPIDVPERTPINAREAPRVPAP
jgi:hypothetical protein